MAKSYSSIKAGWTNTSLNSDGTQKKKSYSEIKPSNYDFGVDDKYVNDFVTESNNYFKKAYEDSKSVGFSNASSLYDTNKSTDYALREKANTIKAFYNANKQKIGKDSYDKMMSYLDDFNSQSSNSLGFYKNLRDYYSQWGSEDEYNQYVTNNKEYNEKKSFDLEGGKYELDNLRRLYDDANSAELDARSQYEATDLVSKILRDSGYSTAEELKDAIAEKETYYNQAKHIQAGEALRNEALNAEDFEVYSQRGADLENPDFNHFGDINNKVKYARDNKNTLQA